MFELEVSSVACTSRSWFGSPFLMVGSAHTSQLCLNGVIASASVQVRINPGHREKMQIISSYLQLRIKLGSKMIHEDCYSWIKTSQLK